MNLETHMRRRRDGKIVCYSVEEVLAMTDFSIVSLVRSGGQNIPDSKLFVTKEPNLDVDVLTSMDGGTSKDDSNTIVPIPHFFYNEASVLELLAMHPHPAIVQLLGVVEDDEGIELHLEYVHTPEGKKNMRFEDDHDLLTYTEDLASALNHIHSLGFAHLDVKPTNVLRNERGYKLIDLGSARFVGVCGIAHDGELPLAITERFVAPEVPRRKGYNGYLSTAADSWSLGMTIDHLTYNPKTNRYYLREKTSLREAKDYPTPLLRFMSHLANQLMVIDPGKRQNMQWVLDEIATYRAEQRPQIDSSPSVAPVSVPQPPAQPYVGVTRNN